jgi:hypothetical protein
MTIGPETKAKGLLPRKYTPKFLPLLPRLMFWNLFDVAKNYDRRGCDDAKRPITLILDLARG